MVHYRGGPGSFILLSDGDPWSFLILFRFETIQYLFVLIAVLPLIALFIGLIYWKRWNRAKLGSHRLVARLLQEYSPRKFNTKVILVLVAITCGILAAANLRKPDTATGAKGAGVDVMLVLDVSKSMLSQDVAPSRLDKARQFINQLLPAIGDNRVGLVVFAGQAYLQMPVTSDMGAAKMFVANASPDMVPVQGTVFNQALTVAANSLNVKERKYKVAILVSDGEDNDEEAIATAQQLAETSGLVVHTVGIGSAEGSNILEPGSDAPKRDAEGNIIVSKLNEALLQGVAQATTGTYHHLTDVTASANAIAREINGMEKKGLASIAGATYTNSFPWLIALALLLLLVEIIISERRKKIAA